MDDLNYRDLRGIAGRHGQDQLFAFWDELDDSQRRELLSDVAQIDFDTLDRLIPTHVKQAATLSHIDGPLEPPEAYPAVPGPDERVLYSQASALGHELLKYGKVAAMVVAGGQGTRLGFDRPKGEFRISPVKDKSLFQLFAEAILATGKRYGRPVPWYVMTGPTTDAPTREYFAGQRYLGLSERDVFFFCQGVMPAVGKDGRILLDQKHRVSLSPNGHGGSLLALASSGALADMAARGIEHLSYFQVDNPLASPVDPFFIGLHARTGAEMSGISVSKADDLERVGHFVRAGGKLCVIEYSDIPEELVRAKNPDGSRRLDDGNIAIHAFSREFLERLTPSEPEAQAREKLEARNWKHETDISLPWHRAEKKVPYIDIATGRRIEPQMPNAIKLELFVFDALPLARRAIVLRQDRAECFSPVKNADGVDSPATARRDMVRRAARWLESCGVELPRRPDGEPDCLIEISPRFALDAEQLKSRLNEIPVIARGGRVYLE